MQNSDRWLFWSAVLTNQYLNPWSNKTDANLENCTVRVLPFFPVEIMYQVERWGRKESTNWSSINYLPKFWGGTPCPLLRSLGSLGPAVIVAETMPWQTKKDSNEHNLLSVVKTGLINLPKFWGRDPLAPPVAKLLQPVISSGRDNALADEDNAWLMNYLSQWTNVLYNRL